MERRTYRYAVRAETGHYLAKLPASREKARPLQWSDFRSGARWVAYPTAKRALAIVRWLGVPARIVTTAE